jgi:hypothetical protein
MKEPLFLLAALFCGALAGVACKDDPKRPPVESEGPAYPSGSVGGGSSRDAAALPVTDGGDPDAGECTDLENTGSVVDQTAVIDDTVPLGTGGTILDGTYNLTSAQIFEPTGSTPGPTNATYAGSLRITGSTFERVIVTATSTSTQAGLENRVTGTIVPSGVNAKITLSCPIAVQEQVTYTVADESLTLSNLTTKESFVFTKQP